jgi:hypothetical protein
MTAHFEYGVPPTEHVLGALNDSVVKYVDGVCDMLEIDVVSIISPKRNRPLADLRHVLMFMMRTKFHMTYSEVGSFFHRNHSTVIHAENKIKTLIEANQIDFFLGQCLQAAEEIFNEQWGQPLKSNQHGA